MKNIAYIQSLTVAILNNFKFVSDRHKMYIRHNDWNVKSETVGSLLFKFNANGIILVSEGKDVLYDDKIKYCYIHLPREIVLKRLELQYT